MTISIISAIANNFAIGKDNHLLYHMPNDLKRFKDITTGHPVIMGKNTFLSLPKRPLPNRDNIVLALPDEVPDDKEGAYWVNSLKEAFDYCTCQNEVFVIGGASVYKQALEFADKLYLTVIDDNPEDADAFFPRFDFDEWDLVYLEKHRPDDKHEKGYCFITLERKDPDLVTYLNGIIKEQLAKI